MPRERAPSSVSLSSTEIARVVAELAPLVGGRVQKLWVPEPRLVILEIFAQRATHLLLLSAIPDETRIHRATERPASPPTPYAFQGLLRAHLEPARLVSLEAVPGDRVVRLGFETPQGNRTLVGELTGRHRLVLVDVVDGRQKRLDAEQRGPVQDLFGALVGYVIWEKLYTYLQHKKVLPGGIFAPR